MSVRHTISYLVQHTFQSRSSVRASAQQQRLHRAAIRFGFLLQRSRVRRPSSRDPARYRLLDISIGDMLGSSFGDGVAYTLTLSDIEMQLAGMSDDSNLQLSTATADP